MDTTTTTTAAMTATDTASDLQRIANQVRSLRQAKGMTALQLAEATGIKRPNITRLETGRHAITLDTLSRICNALGAKIQIVPD